MMNMRFRDHVIDSIEDALNKNMSDVRILLQLADALHDSKNEEIMEIVQKIPKNTLDIAGDMEAYIRMILAKFRSVEPNSPNMLFIQASTPDLMTWIECIIAHIITNKEAKTQLMSLKYRYDTVMNMMDVPNASIRSIWVQNKKFEAAFMGNTNRHNNNQEALSYAQKVAQDIGNTINYIINCRVRNISVDPVVIKQALHAVDVNTERVRMV